MADAAAASPAAGYTSPLGDLVKPNVTSNSNLICSINASGAATAAAALLLLELGGAGLGLGLGVVDDVLLDGDDAAGLGSTVELLVLVLVLPVSAARSAGGGGVMVRV